MADLAYGVLGDFPLTGSETLSLVNSNAFSTAIATLALADCHLLLDSLDVAGALDLEAFAANLSVLHPAVARVRPYPGIVTSIGRLRDVLAGSYLWDEGAARNLQDPLTFRNLAQVHGAARDAIDHADAMLAIELNASQQNPLLVLEERRFISVANYDVLPLAAALDLVRISLAPVADLGVRADAQAAREPVLRPPARPLGRPRLARGRALGVRGRDGRARERGAPARTAGLVRARLDEHRRGHRGPR